MVGHRPAHPTHPRRLLLLHFLQLWVFSNAGAGPSSTVAVCQSVVDNDKSRRRRRRKTKHHKHSRNGEAAITITTTTTINHSTIFSFQTLTLSLCPLSPLHQLTKPECSSETSVNSKTISFTFILFTRTLICTRNEILGY